MHALAGIDHRPSGVDQQRRRLFHMDRVGAVAGAQHRRVVERFRDFLVPHVRGYLDDDRSAAAIFQPGEGAPEDIADFGCDVDRLGRLRKSFHRLAGIEVRFDVGEAPRIAHRQHQHRHGLAIALRHATHGVFRAGTVLHAEGTDLVPGTDPGNSVRHVQSNPLLPHHHRADIDVGRVLYEMIDRIAAENLDSLALHDFYDGGAEFHADSSPSRPMLRSTCAG